MVIKSFLKRVRADAICLQETKLEVVDRGLIREIWGGHYVDWEFLPACGASGGILLCWDSRIVVREKVGVGNFLVSCLFSCVEGGFRWVFTRVHRPVIGAKRERFL